MFIYISVADHTAIIKDCRLNLRRFLCIIENSKLFGTKMFHCFNKMLRKDQDKELNMALCLLLVDRADLFLNQRRCVALFIHVLLHISMRSCHYVEQMFSK